jgi:DNA modification methylase
MVALAQIPDASVHMILADLPYGTTYAKWDSVIPMARLWEQYKRIIIGNGAIVLHASQPFTSMLVCSNPGWFRHEWIWDKENATNFTNAKRGPLKQHEEILVFAAGQVPYYPIKTQGKPNHKQGAAARNYDSETMLVRSRAPDDESGLKYPKSILYFPKHSSQCRYHPTEKPVALSEYLVKTYTQEGEVVLDNTMGSGTTGVACVRTNRKFIGMEIDEGHFNSACSRMMAEGMSKS